MIGCPGVELQAERGGHVCAGRAGLQPAGAEHDGGLAAGTRSRLLLLELGRYFARIRLI